MPVTLDQQGVVLLAWGVFAPFMWFLSARSLPGRLGLRPLRGFLVIAAVACIGVALFAARVGVPVAAMTALASSAVLSTAGLRLFEPADTKPVGRLDDPRLPLFARLSYAWLLVAGAFAVWAARSDTAGGIWIAARHAFTVGFMSTIVLTIGHRMMPAFADRTLWSPRLMALGLTCLNAGSLVRVAGEILAREQHVQWAWSALPPSGITELTGFAVCALDILVTMVW